MTLSPMMAPALTSAPAMMVTPRPMRAVSAIVAAGWMALTNSRPKPSTSSHNRRLELALATPPTPMKAPRTPSFMRLASSESSPSTLTPSTKVPCSTRFQSRSPITSYPPDRRSMSSTTRACPPAPIPTTRMTSGGTEALSQKCPTERRLCKGRDDPRRGMTIAVRVGQAGETGPERGRRGALDGGRDLRGVRRDVDHVCRTHAPSLSIADVDDGHAERRRFDDAAGRIADNGGRAGQEAEVIARAEARHEERASACTNKRLNRLTHGPISRVAGRCREHQVKGQRLERREQRLDLPRRLLIRQCFGVIRDEQELVSEFDSMSVRNLWHRRQRHESQ